jgi:ABC-type multidrug transport system permease subunit
MLCCALVGNSIGIMSGSLFKDAKRATALTPAFILPMMMLSGLYNKLGSIPIFIRWLQYLSPFRYGIHSLLLQ